MRTPVFPLPFLFHVFLKKKKERKKSFKSNFYSGNQIQTYLYLFTVGA